MPRPTSPFKPIRKHAGYVDCLVHFYTELARVGLRVRDLKDLRQTVLFDIEHGAHEINRMRCFGGGITIETLSGNAGRLTTRRSPVSS